MGVISVKTREERGCNERLGVVLNRVIGARRSAFPLQHKSIARVISNENTGQNLTYRSGAGLSSASGFATIASGGTPSALHARAFGFAVRAVTFATSQWRRARRAGTRSDSRNRRSDRRIESRCYRRRKGLGRSRAGGSSLAVGGSFAQGA